MDRRDRRTRRLAPTLAIALTALAVGPQATAAEDGGRRRTHVSFTQSAPVTVGGDFGCDPSDSTRCAGTFRNVRTLTGDFSGTTYQTGTAVPLPDGTYQGVAVVQFTGTLAPCGSGTLVIVEHGRLDPISGASWGTWVIEAGQGTGDLAGVSGRLSADSRVSDETSGRIRCR